MNLGQKLKVCENYIKNKGYTDAAIVAPGLDNRMLVFRIPNVTAKYPNEHPNVSVAFANGSMNSGEIDFDVMQVMCFISSGVPENRLLDIQKFCSDFNKAMQIGFFGVDFKNANVYFKCAQVIEKNVNRSELETIIDNVLTMIIFYFGYAFEILIELSYGVIGYGSTSNKLKERKRMIEAAMAEINGEDDLLEPEFIKNADKDTQSSVIEEIFNQLKEKNPDILDQANIDLSMIKRKRKGRSGKKQNAEETAIKILKLAEAEKNAIPVKKATVNISEQIEEPVVEVMSERITKKNEEITNYNNQMPSVEMFAQRKNNANSKPFDLEELQRALEIEQEERARINAARKKNEETMEENLTVNQEKNNSSQSIKKSQDSLLQRLKKWTQN